MLKFNNRIAVALGATLLAAALANAQPAAKPAASAMQGMSMPSANMDMKAMMKDMNDKMSSMKMTGNQDMDFAMMMRIHHQGAIAMAEAELSGGKEQEMKTMAKNVISAQKKEIAQIDKFLAKHGHSPETMKK